MSRVIAVLPPERRPMAIPPKDGQVQQFTFGLMDLRVLEHQGQPWFVAADVCEALGLQGFASKHTARLQSDERLVVKKAGLRSITANGRPLVSGPTPSITFVSESGLYRLIMRSDKPEAKAFQDWVTRVVLPAIRKDGAYIQGEEKVVTGEMSEDELLSKAFGILQKKVERLTQEKAELVREKAVLQHQVDHLTVRQYERDLGRYLNSSVRGRLSFYAKSYCLARNIPITKTEMAFTDGMGTERASYANVYPREALNYAAQVLGVAA